MERTKAVQTEINRLEQAKADKTSLDQLKDEFEKFKSQQQDEVEVTVQKVVRKEIRDMKESERRSIMIYGIDEPTCDTEQLSIAADTDTVSKFITDKLKVVGVKIAKCFRVGRKKQKLLRLCQVQQL